MNWTGGTRSRAVKTSTTSRLQKRYFSKVRAAAQTFAIPSSQENIPNVFKRKRQTTPEFDIVVKKARADHREATRNSASPLLDIDKDSRKKVGGAVEEDIRKARRRMLLEREDWVCTTLSKPLVLKSKEEMRKLKANFHREVIETSSSGSTSSEDEGGGGEDGDDDNEDYEDEDDDGSSTLRNYGEQGVASIMHENRRRMVPHEDTPELPEYPENNEDIYIRIGGSTQKSATSTTDPTRSTESANRSTEINPTPIRGSSADTMLLDFDKHEPMFQFQHITPAVSDMVERKRREVRQSGYSSSPLARYSRQRGNRVPMPLDGGPGEVGQTDFLIEEVERVSSPVPSSPAYSTIILRNSPGSRGRECLYLETEEAIEHDFPRTASMGDPVDEKIRKEETLGHTRMTSITLGSSQVPWSTSPAERRPYLHQGEQPFDEMASEIISSENLLNLKPFACSENGTQTQVEVALDAERDIHETDDEDEEGAPGNNGTREIAEVEAEESEMEMDQDDDSPDDNQDRCGPMSQDSNEESMKDTQESTDYEWDEEDTTATHGETGEILGTIRVASTVAHEGTWAEIIGLIADNPTLHAQENPIVVQDSSNQIGHSQTEHNLVGCNNTQDSLGSTADDQEVFTHPEWLDKVLATSSDLFKSPAIHAAGHGEYEGRETNTSPDPDPDPSEPEKLRPPDPTPTKKHEKRPARRFLITPDQQDGGNPRGVTPFRAREREHGTRHGQQQHKGPPHPPPENITSPIASPVALVYSGPYRLGPGFRERSVSAGGAGGIRRNVGRREGGGRGLVREGYGGEVEGFEDIEDF